MISEKSERECPGSRIDNISKKGTGPCVRKRGKVCVQQLCGIAGNVDDDSCGGEAKVAPSQAPDRHHQISANKM